MLELLAKLVPNAYYVFEYIQLIPTSPISILTYGPLHTTEDFRDFMNIDSTIMDELHHEWHQVITYNGVFQK